MTDAVVLDSGAKGAGRSAMTRGGRWWPPDAWPPAVCWALAGLLLVPLAIYYWRWEGTPANIFFTASSTALVIAALTLASRRLLFAVASSVSLIWIIVLVAGVKRAKMNMVVHAYDLVFYFSSWSTVSFLWTDYRVYMLGLLAGFAGLVAAAWLAWRLDGTRISRRHAGLALVLAMAATAAGAELKGERRHMQFNFENLYVSSFFASWGETAETLWRGQLVEAAPPGAPGLAPLAAPGSCTPQNKPPHIILIHQESVVPPGLFKELSYDRGLDSLFRSNDGSTRPLRVETYGGASWLTEFSILAGVSTHSFGGMRQFVQSLMEGKLKDTVPQALERCGYRNVVFYPMLKNFVSNARFYTSIGLKEIFDLKDQGARVVNERDRFYYRNALAEIERHVASSSRPMFTFIQTMATHWPYDVEFSPEEKVAGGGPGTHPELHEYLRRLALAKRDYEYLLAELRTRFPGERFLVMHYGDHQPTPTRLLLGFGEETEAEDVTLDPNSLGFLTYYAVDGINYRPPALPDVEALEVPYLGSVLLQAAGLPLSASHAERLRLMQTCAGRYHTCARRDEILAFHRRLISSRLMEAR